MLSEKKTTLSLMRQKYSTDILKTEPAVGYSLFTHSLCFGVDAVPCHLFSFKDLLSSIFPHSAVTGVHLWSLSVVTNPVSHNSVFQQTVFICGQEQSAELPLGFWWCWHSAKIKATKESFKTKVEVTEKQNDESDLTLVRVVCNITIYESNFTMSISSM